MTRPTGSIEVICGPMFSGKSEELLHRLRRAIIGHRVVRAFKPTIDRRYHDTRITSHSGQSFDACLSGCHPRSARAETYELTSRLVPRAA